VDILDGVVEAIQILKYQGLVPVVVSNQPNVARGLLTQAIVEDINTRIGEEVKIKYFYTCFHDDGDSCVCRKPLPGLILQAAYELNLDTHKSFMVGDRWRDIAAGQAAGCESFFIDYSYPEPYPNQPFSRVKSLLEAAEIIKGRLTGVR
jgi:D-glycero-D-manno-heptose 1,7-bisphosphate phosphatase